MPTIPIDFSGVESFDSLPLGEYEGSIDKIELKPTDDVDKFDQIQAGYIVTDGEFTGRKQSEFLSLSPKAAFRLKRWFDKFGLADGQIAALDFDDDSNLLLEPDLVGYNVIFRVYEDPKPYRGEKQIRTELVEVLDDDEPAPPVKAPAKPSARRAAAVAPAPEPEDDDESTEDEEEDAPADPTPARRPARAAATATAAPARRRLK